MPRDTSRHTLGGKNETEGLKGQTAIHVQGIANTGVTVQRCAVVRGGVQGLCGDVRCHHDCGHTLPQCQRPNANNGVCAIYIHTHTKPVPACTRLCAYLGQ